MYTPDPPLLMHAPGVQFLRPLAATPNAGAQGKSHLSTPSAVKPSIPLTQALSARAENKSVPFSKAQIGGVGGQQVFEVVEDVRGFAEGVDLRGAHGFEGVMRHRQ